MFDVYVQKCVKHTKKHSSPEFVEMKRQDALPGMVSS